MSKGETRSHGLPTVRTLQQVGQLLLAIAGLVVAAQSLIDSFRRPEPADLDDAGPIVANQEGN